MISTQSNTYRWMLRVTPDTPPEFHEGIDPSSTHLKEPRLFKCANCMSPVAFEVDIIQIGDIPSDTAQVNPHGFIHEVITVRSVQNTLLEVTPVPADSWFPGFGDT